MKTFPRRICTLAPLLLSLSPLAADTTRYIVFNRAPGQGMDQAQPESLGHAAFDEVLTCVFNRESLIAHPTIVGGIRVIGDVHPESERFYVRLGKCGATAPMVAQAWDAGRFTGLRLAREVSAPRASRGRLGLSLRDIRVELLAP